MLSNSLPVNPGITTNNKHLLWLVIGVIVLLFAIVITLIIVGVNLIISSANRIPVYKPEVRIEEKPVVPPPSKASPYATDSGLLKIRNDLQELRKDVESVDLFETQLSPPNLDLNIGIPVAN